MAIVKNSKQLGNGYYRLDLADSIIARKGIPGQFLHIKISSDNVYDPLLRRPFSIYDINRDKGIVTIVYRVVGRGTQILKEVDRGNHLDVLGPLGRGFSTDWKNKFLILIGGGMGLAPLYFLAKKLVTSNRVLVLAGGNSEEDLAFFNESYGLLDLNLLNATLDGSTGYKGNVIELFEEQLSYYNPDYIFGCGPRGMLKRLKEITEEHNLMGEISLEERMGCGYGVCLSCVCNTEKGNQRVCKEGPVFNINEVIFDGQD
ncbi:dihydroorotate dehydrogenase electron transfer subunit [Halothermothrix orenii]|nr:dihydroorotate dehydrogenase electron transfer subunit [Halothermothrix orenii]